MSAVYWRWDQLVQQELGFGSWYALKAQERLRFLESNRKRIISSISSRISYYRKKCGLPITASYKHRVRSDAEFEYMLFLRERGVTFTEIARRQKVTPSTISSFIKSRTMKRNYQLSRELVLFPILKSILEHDSPPPRQAEIVSQPNLSEQSASTTAMTDLEITKRCAAALGYLTDPTCVVTEQDILVLRDGKWAEMFNPLHDDAQAMALMKKFPDQVLDELSCFLDRHPRGVNPAQQFNRVICECVARMEGL